MILQYGVIAACSNVNVHRGECLGMTLNCIYIKLLFIDVGSVCGIYLYVGGGYNLSKSANQTISL